MNTLKSILITMALLVFAAFLVASWYIVLLFAVVFILYTLSRTYVAVKGAYDDIR